jgi:hypothetical protein
MMRPMFLLLVIVTYFAVELAVGQTALSKTEAAARTIYVASLRAPRWQNALALAAQNVGTSHELLRIIDDRDPRLVGDDYWTGAAKALTEGREASFAVLFGHAMDIDDPFNDELQKQLMYENICDFPVDKAYELMPELREQPQLFRDCEVLESGILKRGLFGAMQTFDDIISPLTTYRYSLGIADLIQGIPVGSQLTTAEALETISVYQSTNQLYTDYLFYLLQLSSKLYIEYAKTFIEHYQAVRVVMLSLASVFLFGFFIFGINPLVAGLSRNTAQVNAMMLLLPYQTIKHVKPAQAYIDRNLTLE